MRALIILIQKKKFNLKINVRLSDMLKNMIYIFATECRQSNDVFGLVKKCPIIDVETSLRTNVLASFMPDEHKSHFLDRPP